MKIEIKVLKLKRKKRYFYHFLIIIYIIIVFLSSHVIKFLLTLTEDDPMRDETLTSDEL